jgi:hypothetical protein
VAKKTPRKQDYKELRDTWYAKLEKSGFNDIEKTNGTLKSWSNRFSTDRVLREYDAKLTYSLMATQFLNNYKFETKFETIIWEYHTNAISIDDMADIIYKLKITKFKKKALHTTIYRIITRLRREMFKLYMNGYK